MEGILGLESEVLTILLGPSRRGRGVGYSSGHTEFAEFLTTTGALDRLLAEIDAPPVGLLRVISVFEELEVGADRAGCWHLGDPLGLATVRLDWQ